MYIYFIKVIKRIFLFRILLPLYEYVFLVFDSIVSCDMDIFLLICFVMLYHCIHPHFLEDLIFFISFTFEMYSMEIFLNCTLFIDHIITQSKDNKTCIILSFFIESKTIKITFDNNNDNLIV